MADEAGLRVNFIGSAAGLESPKVWPDFNPLQRAIFKQGIKLSIVLGAAIHETGGARMGNDPAMSVVNGVNQLWDAPNVFVPDAASFVSGSTVGPALTIMALSARSAAFVAEHATDGTLTRPPRWRRSDPSHAALAKANPRAITHLSSRCDLPAFGMTLDAALRATPEGLATGVIPSHEAF